MKELRGQKSIRCITEDIPLKLYGCTAKENGSKYWK